MGRWTGRAGRALLSDDFILRLKLMGITGYHPVPPEYNISTHQLRGWMSGANKAPKDHAGLHKLAAKVGIEKERMFM